MKGEKLTLGAGRTDKNPGFGVRKFSIKEQLMYKTPCFVSSVSNFASKLGQGMASGVIGLIMGLAGYDGNLEVQSAAANTAIVGLFNILPLVLYIVMFILAIMWKMDSFRGQMNADLKARHEAQ